MKKLRYSLITIVVVVALILISARAMELHFSPENVLEAREAAMHYGPSDEVVYKYTRSDGTGIIIGQCGDEGLSIAKTRRVLGFLYMPDAGVCGYYPRDKQISVHYDDDLDMVYGLSYGEPGEDILIKMSTENEQLFQQTATTDEKGFFYINDVSQAFLDDQSDSHDEYYIYAENVLPVEDMDIRINSNMPKGLVVDRSELDKLMPEADEFMRANDIQPSANINSDVLNKINAGIKKYTGIDFFACEGGTDGETVCLYYDRSPWSDTDLVLTFKKNGDRFVPVATDENMDTVAISWLCMNYGKKYDVRSVSSQKREVTEKDGKKQYWTLLSSYLSLRSNGVSGEMNVEVVVEADLNDPEAPWKMYYVNDTYGPDGTLELRDINELIL